MSIQTPLASDPAVDKKSPLLRSSAMQPAPSQPGPLRVTSPSAAASFQDLAHSPRLLSLDALRGFDMFWIVGAEDIVHSLHKANPSPVVDFFTQQLSHVAWQGLAFYDLIFPLFIFIVGVSLVFSLTKTVERHGHRAAYQRVITRGVVLYLLGIFYYGGFAEGVDRIRLLGVLQRIAICYLVAGLLFCTFKTRGLIVVCAGLLIGYWALMTFVPVPGIGAGSFQEGANLANWVDKEFLPFRKWDGDHDPEGLLSTLPAIGTCLLGVFAGLLMRNPALQEQQKVLFLLAGGIAGVVIGSVWGWQFPIIKKLWTSSYVLIAAGFSCLFFAAFHQIIEVWRLRSWAVPFVWIGLNPLTIYMAHNLVDFTKISNRLFGGPIKGSFGTYADVIVTMGILGLTFWLAHFLYRRKIFLRL